MKQKRISAVLFLAAICLSGSVYAQDFGDLLKHTIEKVTKQEVEQKVEDETRRVVRCALGDEACIEAARERGEQVEIVKPKGAAAGGSAMQGAKASGDGSRFSLVPYRNSERDQNQVDAFNEYERIIDKKKHTERLEGRLTRQRYQNPQGRSTLEIMRNYESALKRDGFSIDFSCSGRSECGNPAAEPSWMSLNGMNLGIGGDVRYLTVSKNLDGAGIYVSIAVNPHIHYIHTLETAAMEGDMASVESLAADLEREGRIAFGNVYFDSGKATLRPESAQALSQMARLLSTNPDISVYVVGHTDGVGGLDANLGLSRARAAAVVDALAGRYGVGRERVVPAGVGPLAPVASNRFEEGRARNRRVEMVQK